MSSAIKYMVDDKGQKTSVLVPLKTSTKKNEDYKRLQNKFKVFSGINNALKEVKATNKSSKKLQSLKDFLRESNS